jgi:glycosyltransferase involved in cell wall biosynthesis
MSQPGLVSFLIIAYRQERFIREAVRGALSQTYEPLEVIISDDCSPDRTFDVIKEEVEAYRGPHKVIVNRNEANVGLAGNLNMAWSLSHGEFVVAQGGDDISMPQRTETLLQARQPRRWIASSPTMP